MRYYSRPKNKGCLRTVITFPFYLIYYAVVLCGSFVLGVFTFLWELIKLPFTKVKPLSGAEYEQTVAKYLKKKGYWGVKVTQVSGDYGVDVIAHKNGHKYAVQCKYYSDKVGLDAVQEVVAGMAIYGCDKAMVVTNNTYTEAAKTLAGKNGVALLSGVQSSDFSIPRKTLLRVVAVLIYVCFSFAIISVTLDTIKEQSFWFAVHHLCTTFALLLTPLWVFLVYLCVKRLIARLKNDRSKKIFFVVIRDSKYFKQFGKGEGGLDVSGITGLPHKFTIMGEKYNIDVLNDVINMPLNFSSFDVNGTKYYFNNYLRLCAKLYKDNGCDELSEALIKKAADIENDPAHGAYIRKKAKTFIFSPKGLNHKIW